MLRINFFLHFFSFDELIKQDSCYYISDQCKTLSSLYLLEISTSE